MLYFFYGDDYVNKQNAIESLKQKIVNETGSKIINFYYSEENKQLLENYIFGKGFFGEKSALVLSNPSDSTSAHNFLVANAKAMADSENIFIISEEGLERSFADTLAVCASQKYEFKSRDNLQKFNIFSLSDALGRRDRKGLWTAIIKAQISGVKDEDILWNLAWITKSIAMVGAGVNVQDSGLKPFAFSKATNFARNYPNKEILKIYNSLLDIHKKSRRGEVDLSGSLEMLALSI